MITRDARAGAGLATSGSSFARGVHKGSLRRPGERGGAGSCRVAFDRSGRAADAARTMMARPRLCVRFGPLRAMRACLPLTEVGALARSLAALAIEPCTLSTPLMQRVDSLNIPQINQHREIPHWYVVLRRTRGLRFVGRLVFLNGGRCDWLVTSRVRKRCGAWRVTLAFDEIIFDIGQPSAIIREALAVNCLLRASMIGMSP